MRDPSQPIQFTRAQRAAYRSFQELAASEREGVDFSLQVSIRDPAVVVLAPHAGGIEPATGEIAEAIAGTQISFYQFVSNYPDRDMRLHITSSRFDEPQAVQMVGQSRYTVTVHGCNEEEENVFIGGRDEVLSRLVKSALSSNGFPVSSVPHPLYKGLSRENICNRNLRGQGVQLELSEGIRLRLASNPELLDDFARAVRQAIDEARQIDWSLETFGTG